MFNALAINPAYAAVDESMSVTALYRHQWVGFAGAPNTQTISVHTPIKESNTFVGALLVRDQIGEVITETGGCLTLTQRVKIGEKSYISLGINAGLSSLKADYSQIYSQSSTSADDPSFIDENSIRGNMGIGVMLFSDKYYVGISSPHLYYDDLIKLAKNPTSLAYRPHYMIQAGYLLTINDDFKLKPNLLIKYVNGSPVQFDLNANLLIKETVWLGASYRSLDSFDGLFSVFITPDIQFGYSYDFITTKLASVQKGSHEVMLKFRLPIKGRDPARLACYF
jgi:type IX secretion system PorP/SprF family membrane protein